ncbi:hypothetical protein HAX54_007178, partial [Datura stramonium]|nr:hypothetical protein [Datura stramonium]
MRDSDIIGPILTHDQFCFEDQNTHHTTPSFTMLLALAVPNHEIIEPSNIQDADRVLRRSTRASKLE